MRQGLLPAVLLVVLTLVACSHKGVYTKGYYSGRPSKWQRETHLVQAGETLYSIAWQYGHDYREVAKWNGIGEPYTIFPQQELRVMRPEKGDLPLQEEQTLNRPSASTPAAKPPSATTVKTTPKTSIASHRLAWQWPTVGRVLNRSSVRDTTQKGIDIAGKLGQAIYAAEAGDVVYSGSGLRGYGELIIVKHNETYLSAYAHNHRLRVKEGQRVKKGEHIADMGMTDAETVMLHFEIRRDGTPVNPFVYLPKR